ncbi:MAG: SRPBCC family protein [Thermoleophilia bacterium]|nr:SRPBCC family protein [Thermoleophilia bacterium]
MKATPSGRTVRLCALAAAAVFVAYRLLLRPRHLRWGASNDETERSMPGDELIEEPDMISTRAISIEAPPDRVWPWVAQIGRDRGGFYSYDWIENPFGLDIHSADRVVAEYQSPEAGERIALAPDGSGPDVELVEKDRLLVLREPGGGWTWTFMLEPSGDCTRLLVRNRWSNAGRPFFFRLFTTLIDPAVFVMERKTLRGIRERAEGVG